ncbi:hypothetical protein [Novipirellula herctigrandis]
MSRFFLVAVIACSFICSNAEAKGRHYNRHSHHRSSPQSGFSIRIGIGGISGFGYSGHQYSGHQYSGHQYSGHQYSGHQYSGLGYSGHRYQAYTYPVYGYSTVGSVAPYGLGYINDPYQSGSFKVPDLLDDPLFIEQHRHESRFPGRRHR